MRIALVLVLAVSLFAAGCSFGPRSRATANAPAEPASTAGSRAGYVALGAVLGAVAVIAVGVIAIKRAADDIPDFSGLEEGYCGSGCH